jgi:hypothetical protein
VRYEFLFQSAEPGAPYDPDPVAAALVARGATVEPDGTLRWKVGGDAAEAKPLKEGGQVIATELRLPLSGDAAYVKAALEGALAVAAEVRCRLFDPQLMRVLTPADAEPVAVQYARTAKYVAEMVGAPEVLGSAGYAAEGYPSYRSEPTGGMSGQAKLLLALACLAALYLVVSGLSGSLMGE